MRSMKNLIMVKMCSDWKIVFWLVIGEGSLGFVIFVLCSLSFIYKNYRVLDIVKFNMIF